MRPGCESLIRHAACWQQNGTNITNADLQAIWWYPEKNLYAKMGGRDSEAINVDYASAIADLARKKVVSEGAIARAVGSAHRGPGPAGSDVASGVKGRSAQGIGVNAPEGAAEVVQERPVITVPRRAEPPAGEALRF
jgi:hypothetical protein